MPREYKWPKAPTWIREEVAEVEDRKIGNDGKIPALSSEEKNQNIQNQYLKLKFKKIFHK